MQQHTIKKEVSISGTGLHSGRKVTIKFKPAGAGSGITFKRSDVAGSPAVRADLKNVSSTIRGTSLGSISTVEHVLSALYALSVTNAEIELDGPEPPALDGSSKGYCALIMKAGISPQKGETGTVKVSEPILIAEGGKCLIAVPSDRFTVSFMINYPSDFIGTQFRRIDIGGKDYIEEIAPARTYGFIEELDALKKQGLALGATDKNAVAIGPDKYLTKLRFSDELVRHKILDLLGDLSLLCRGIKAHVIGIRSGHDLNIKFARKLEEVG